MCNLSCLKWDRLSRSVGFGVGLRLTNVRSSWKRLSGILRLTQHIMAIYRWLLSFEYRPCLYKRIRICSSAWSNTSNCRGMSWKIMRCRIFPKRYSTWYYCLCSVSPTEFVFLWLANIFFLASSHSFTLRTLSFRSFCRARNESCWLLTLKNERETICFTGLPMIDGNFTTIDGCFTPVCVHWTKTDQVYATRRVIYRCSSLVPCPLPTWLLFVLASLSYPMTSSD